MTPRNPREVLGVSQEATFEEIRAAYLKLASQYHPDVNKDKGVRAKFNEVNEAYKELVREMPEAYEGNQKEWYLPVGTDSFIKEVFGDIFPGFKDAPPLQRRGRDLHIPLTISSDDAAKGIDREIEFMRTELCQVCMGSGARPGTSPIPCKTCEGKGQVRHVNKSELGTIVTSGPCPDCKGRGEIVLKPCKHCKGTRVEKLKIRLMVHIPMGSTTGGEIEMEGEGEVSLHAEKHGNLYVNLKVE